MRRYSQHERDSPPAHRDPNMMPGGNLTDAPVQLWPIIMADHYGRSLWPIIMADHYARYVALIAHAPVQTDPNCNGPPSRYDYYMVLIIITSAPLQPNQTTASSGHWDSRDAHGRVIFVGYY